MTDRGKIVGIYAGVVAFTVAFVGGMMWLGKQVPDQPQPQVMVDPGKVKEEKFFQIAKDFGGMNQAGKEVKLSDLKGKVWIVSEFFAICPHCAKRNGVDLMEIFGAFKDDPDFRMVCISVDPQTDTLERLQDYGKNLGADPEKWWFISHPNQQETHEYLEKELKFFGIRERTDPVDRDTNGRYAHDMGIMLVDRDWNVIGKWPLYDASTPEARKRDPELYDQLKKELMDRVRAELDRR
jgi:protein SCO1/2